jgi:hypothetical protein
MVLFLNKSDLFAAKIQTVPLSVCFPEMTQQLDYDAGWQFIRDKFLSLNKNPAQKHIYTHVTCATSTENVRVVFGAVKDIILSDGMRTHGPI